MVVGQNANRTKCQPDIMPNKGWHFVRAFFCGWHFVRPNFLVGILSGPSKHVLAFCRIKSIAKELQQIKSGVRAKLLLGKWVAAQDLDTDTTLDCKECGKTFSISANLRWHLTTQHNKRKAVTEPSQPNVKFVKFVLLAINVNTI